MKNESHEEYMKRIREKHLGDALNAVNDWFEGEKSNKACEEKAKNVQNVWDTNAPAQPYIHPTQEYKMDFGEFAVKVDFSLN